MSADRWSICPKCTRSERKEIEEKTKSLNEKYGVIPVGEWIGLKKKLEYLKSEPQNYTLEENFEIGIYDGNPIFKISYSCYCNCGFEFQFKKEIHINTEV